MPHLPPISMKTASTLSAYRGVTFASTTAYTVGYPETNTAIPCGITVNEARNSTVQVAVPGTIARLYFNDSVVASGLVALDSSGRGVPFTIGAQTTSSFTVQSAYIGRLVGPKVDATGTIAEVFIQPGYARGSS